ncbi:MAG: hypothetical protein KJZ47_01265, partial [Gemmatimonadales bacterium]|nr:hypothetical protein [Gemmatimonadales bacterium]
MRRDRALAALLLALAACGGEPDRSLVTSLGAQQSQRPVQRPSLDASRQTALVTATSRVSPAVVSIQVQARRLVPRGRGFFDFFMFPGEEEETTQSFGTGFVYRDGI